MPYIARKRMKVKFEDGSYGWISPGDTVPFADTWGNPQLYVERGDMSFVAEGQAPAKAVPAPAPKPEAAQEPEPEEEAVAVAPPEEEMAPKPKKVSKKTGRRSAR